MRGWNKSFPVVVVARADEQVELATENEKRVLRTKQQGIVVLEESIEHCRLLVEAESDDLAMASSTAVSQGVDNEEKFLPEAVLPLYREFKSKPVEKTPNLFERLGIKF